jgi:quercetin dioxygenase-like cupin family protein
VADRFEDKRGVIQDLLGPIDAVTEIFTKRGAIRGNHVHKLTTQWTYVVRGRMKIRTAPHASMPKRTVDTLLLPGMMACEKPGVPHAWLALEDTTVLVFTSGPRSGEAYESDTERLEVPLIHGETL